MLDVIKTFYAINHKSKCHQVYDWHSPVFLFANENISGYLSQINSVQDKTVLSVAASGDHAFECLLAGAKQVDLFDINYLQKHVVELKATMIRHLPYSDFMRFFFDEKRFFSKNIIQPIWHRLSPGLKVFLNHYYNTQDTSIFRYNGAQHSDYLTDQFTYIKYPSEYKNLGRVLPQKFKFTQADITEIPQKFSTVYDMIMLSNIFEYMYVDTDEYDKRLAQFYQQILVPMTDQNLNQISGQVCFDYVWRGNHDQWQNMLNAVHASTHNVIDDFSDTVHKMDAVSVPSAVLDLSQSKKPDLALVLTQKQR